LLHVEQHLDAVLDELSLYSVVAEEVGAEVWQDAKGLTLEVIKEVEMAVFCKSFELANGERALALQCSKNDIVNLTIRSPNAFISTVP
jgi:hypothetical protein